LGRLDGQKGTAGANQVLQVGIFATWPETYYPWIEYWPGNQIKISNLAVNFNDQLFVVVYSRTNYCSSFSTTGVEACGGIDDITTGFSSGTWLAPKPSGASFVGKTAEFIVERVCAANCLPNQQNPTFDALLNFQQIWIDGEAEDSAGNWRDFATDFYWEDQIQNASHQTLATSQDSNGTSTEVVTFYQSQ
jgi:hypothetical protein